MAEENNEIKQEEVVEEKKEPQKEAKAPKPKKEKKHGDNTILFPELADEKKIAEKTKALEKEYKIHKPSVSKIICWVMAGLVALGVIIAIVVLAVTDKM